MGLGGPVGGLISDWYVLFHQSQHNLRICLKAWLALGVPNANATLLDFLWPYVV